MTSGDSAHRITVHPSSSYFIRGDSSACSVHCGCMTTGHVVVGNCLRADSSCTYPDGPHTELASVACSASHFPPLCCTWPLFARRHSRDSHSAETLHNCRRRKLRAAPVEARSVPLQYFVSRALSENCLSAQYRSKCSWVRRMFAYYDHCGGWPKDLGWTLPGSGLWRKENA